MTENTQAVVDATKTEASPSVTVNDAQTGDDLDSLLKQFETETKAAPSPSVTETAPTDVAKLLNEMNVLKGQMAEVSNKTFKTDFDETVKAVKGDLDIDPEIVGSWIDAKARQDNRLQQAWLQRDQKPQEWKRVQAQLGRELAKKFEKQPDKNLTDDTAAVAAAVRAASTKAPADAPVNYANMHNAEYRKSIREQFGFDPGV